MAPAAPVRILTSLGAGDTVRAFLAGVGAGAAPWLSTVDYRRARARFDPSPATWIFADLERLGVDQAFHAGQFRERLATLPGMRCVNDPVHTRRRFEVLRRLYENGLNPIGIWRIEDRRLPARWPVFVRMEHLPLLSEGRLIRDPDDLARTVTQLDAASQYRPALLLEERPDGLPGIDRSVGVLRIGDRLLVERRPEDDAAPSLDDAVVRRLHAIFDLARMRYGRLAVAFADGQPVVWDCDTHPSLRRADARCPPGAVLAALAALGGAP